MKKLLLTSLLLVSSLTAQVQQKIFFSSATFLPSDSSFIVFYAYSIGYNQLVFEKKDESYYAALNISLEILDDKNSLVKRLFDSKQLTVKNYEETNDASKQINGLINFQLPEGKYSFQTIITDLNSKRELKPRPDSVVIKRGKIFQPIVIGKSIECGQTKYPGFINLGGSVPFTDDPIDLIIPILGNGIETIKVAVLNNGEEVYHSEVKDKFVSTLTLELCNEEIIVKTTDKHLKTTNFIVKNINEKLGEGMVQLTVEAGGEKKIFSQYVVWLNKPFSLTNTESAIKSLKYIEDKKAIDKMLDNDEEMYSSILKEYWKKYDPTPSTKFNPLMGEYYGRVDYAAKNFKPIDQPTGINTDRAKTYIKYGKPLKVERYSNGSGKVVETWHYENPGRKFIFVDKEGTGNYILQNG